MKNIKTIALATTVMALVGCNSVTVKDSDLESEFNAQLNERKLKSSFVYQSSPSPYTIQIHDIDFDLDDKNKFSIEGEVHLNGDEFDTKTPISLYGHTDIKLNRATGVLYLSNFFVESITLPEYHGIAVNRIEKELLISSHLLLESQLRSLIVSDFSEELKAYEAHGINLNNFNIDMKTKDGKIVIQQKKKELDNSDLQE